MKLSIYTIRKTIFEGETPRITVPTTTGEITVLENHIPYVSILASGALRYVRIVAEGAGTAEKEEAVAIKGGFIEVRDNNEVRILADE